MPFLLKVFGGFLIGYAIKPEIIPLIMTIVGLTLFALGVTMDFLQQEKGEKDVNSDN